MSVLVATCSLTTVPSVVTTASTSRSSAPASWSRFTAACVSKAKDGIRRHDTWENKRCRVNETGSFLSATSPGRLSYPGVAP